MLLGATKPPHYLPSIMICCIQTNQYTKGFNLINRLLHFHPNYKSVFIVWRGELWYNTKKWENALKDYLEVYSLDIKNHTHNQFRNLFKRIAQCYQQMSNYKKSFEFIEISLTHNPIDLSSLRLKGYLLYQNKKFETAIVVTTKALQMHPNDVELIRYRGSSYFSTNKYRLAELDYSTILNKIPNDNFTRLKRAWCYVELNETQKSVNDFCRCLQTTPIPLKKSDLISYKGIISYFHKFYPYLVNLYLKQIVDHQIPVSIVYELLPFFTQNDIAPIVVPRLMFDLNYKSDSLNETLAFQYIISEIKHGKNRHMINKIINSVDDIIFDRLCKHSYWNTNCRFQFIHRFIKRIEASGNAIYQKLALLNKKVVPTAIQKKIKKIYDLILTTDDGTEIRANIKPLLLNSRFFQKVMDFNGEERETFLRTKTLHVEGLSGEELRFLIKASKRNLHGLEYSLRTALVVLLHCIIYNDIVCAELITDYVISHFDTCLDKLETQIMLLEVGDVIWALPKKWRIRVIGYVKHIPKEVRAGLVWSSYSLAMTTSQSRPLIMRTTDQGINTCKTITTEDSGRVI